jgi:Flp pilus assembly protein TadD
MSHILVRGAAVFSLVGLIGFAGTQARAEKVEIQQSDDWHEADLPAGCRKSKGAEDAKVVIQACSKGLSKLKPAAKGWALFLRAYAHVERGDLAEAERDLRDGIAVAPDNDSLHHELSYVLIEAGDYDGAEGAATKAVNLRPSSPEHFQERAYARMLNGKYDEATEDYSLSLALSDTPAVSALRAFSLALNGDVAEAKSILEVLKVTTDETAKDWMKSANIVLDALKTPDGGSNAAKECQNILTDLDDAKKVVAPCTRAYRDAKTDQERADALRWRSMAWFYGYKWKMPARSDIEAAVRLAPRDNEILAQRGSLLMDIGGERNLARSIADTRRAIQMMGETENEPFVRVNLANALLLAGDAKAAEAEASTVIAVRPDIAGAYWARGSARIKLGDKSAGKADLIEAWARGSRDDRLKAELVNAGVDIDDIKAKPGL